MANDVHTHYFNQAPDSGLYTIAINLKGCMGNLASDEVPKVCSILSLLIYQVYYNTDTILVLINISNEVD